MRNYYAILEIPDFSDAVTVKKAYRRLSKMNHPDVNPNYLPAAEMFKRISEAYSVLSDVERKTAFDRELRNIQSQRSADRSDSGAAETARSSGADDVWDSDCPPVYEHDYFRDTPNPEPREIWRLTVFNMSIYCLDILFGAYILHYRWHLDLSSVPNVHHFGGYHSWVVHLNVACKLQVVSIGYSVFQMVRRRKGLLSGPHIFLKWATAYSFVAPMFGMTMFDLPGATFGMAVLWNAFIGFALIPIWMSRKS